MPDNLGRDTATYLRAINPDTWTYYPDDGTGIDNSGYTGRDVVGTGTPAAYRQAWWTFVPSAGGRAGLTPNSTAAAGQTVEHRVYSYDGATLTLLTVATTGSVQFTVTAGVRYYLMIGVLADVAAGYAFGMYGPAPTPEPLSHPPAGMAAATYLADLNPNSWTAVPTVDNTALTGCDYDGTNRATAYRQAWWTFIPSTGGGAGLIPSSAPTTGSATIEHRVYRYDGATLTLVTVATGSSVFFSVTGGVRYYLMIGILADAPAGYAFSAFAPAPAPDPTPPAPTGGGTTDPGTGGTGGGTTDPGTGGTGGTGTTDPGTGGGTTDPGTGGSGGTGGTGGTGGSGGTGTTDPGTGGTGGTGTGSTGGTGTGGTGGTGAPVVLAVGPADVGLDAPAPSIGAAGTAALVAPIGVVVPSARPAFTVAATADGAGQWVQVQYGPDPTFGAGAVSVSVDAPAGVDGAQLTVQAAGDVADGVLWWRARVASALGAGAWSDPAQFAVDALEGQAVAYGGLTVDVRAQPVPHLWYIDHDESDTDTGGQAVIIGTGFGAAPQVLLGALACPVAEALTIPEVGNGADRRVVPGTACDPWHEQITITIPAVDPDHAGDAITVIGGA